MDQKASIPSSSSLDWPNGNVLLVPAFLSTLEQRLRLLKSRFRHFIETQDPSIGFDLDWLIVNVSEAAFVVIRLIAQEVPPPATVDSCLVAATSALTSELQSVIGGDETSDFISQIEALPNRDWNAVFQGYCQVLEASVDAYIIGDSPVYKVKLDNASAPDLIFSVLRGLVSGLECFPCLRTYHDRLMRKLGNSRSGVVWTQSWMNETPPGFDPTPKRKIDTLDLDGPARKRLMKEMTKFPKLDSLLSSPPSYC